jgi:ribosomal protein S18 acetylase RimI-like enzyme
MSSGYAIRPIAIEQFDAFVAYLDDHASDNGRNGTPLFRPRSRNDTQFDPDKLAAFRAGLELAVGAPKWRKAWAAFGAGDVIAGHVDLRAHPDSCTEHRALLGLGVHRDHRRRGLGKALVQHALDWARRETELEWIDLSFLAGNVPAERLYRSLGFEHVATVADMYRIDGESTDCVSMALRLRKQT